MSLRPGIGIAKTKHHYRDHIFRKAKCIYHSLGVEASDPDRMDALLLGLIHHSCSSNAGILFAGIVIPVISVVVCFPHLSGIIADKDHHRSIVVEVSHLL